MKIYEHHWHNLSAQGGTTTVWELPLPQEARLYKLVVKQASGTASNFSINLFNAKVTTPDPDLYRVHPTINSTSPGVLVKFFTQPNEAVFHNMDSTSHTSKIRKIYVHITPSGSGAMTWRVALGAIVDIG